MSNRRNLTKKRNATSLGKKYRDMESKKKRGKGKGGKEEESKTHEGDSKKVKVCSIENCSEESERSLSMDKYDKTLRALKWKVKDDKSRRLYVCKHHYKDLKKEYKKEHKYDAPQFGREVRKSPRTRKNPLR